MNIEDLNQYKKIYIIGAVGVGKTTLARRLAKKLNYRHFETDVMKWNHKTQQRRSDAERAEILDKILSENNNWIIDGTQSGDWTEKIWTACDIAIMPTAPIVKRIYRVLKRHIRKEEDKSMSLMDLWKNILYTIEFNGKNLPRFRARAKNHNKTIIVWHDKS